MSVRHKAVAARPFRDAPRTVFTSLVDERVEDLR